MGRRRRWQHEFEFALQARTIFLPLQCKHCVVAAHQQAFQGHGYALCLHLSAASVCSAASNPPPPSTHTHAALSHLTLLVTTSTLLLLFARLLGAPFAAPADTALCQ
jgi:hypothetical protein